MSQDERVKEEKIGRKKKGKGAGKGFGDYAFVDIVLTTDEKALFSEDYNDVGVDVLGALELWVESGYKVSVVLDTRGGGVLATLTGRFGAGLNEGLILTARAGGLNKALRVLLFKDEIVCQEGLWAQTAAERTGMSGDIDEDDLGGG